MHWGHALHGGHRAGVRRAERTSLTSSGVAVGIAAMTLIAALGGGLQGALASPALARSQLHQVAVYPAGDSSGFSAGTLATISRQPHVRAAWGQVAMTGTFTAEAASPPAVVRPTGAL